MPSERITTKPGDLLQICAGATKYPDLEHALIDVHSALCEDYRAEFRAAMTALLQEEQEARAKLLQLALSAKAKVQQTRKTTKKRTWGANAETRAKSDADPELEKAVKAELAKIKDGYQQELGAVLKDLQATMDETIGQFANTHLEVMCNARALVEYSTGFELGPTSSSGDVL